VSGPNRYTGSTTSGSNRLKNVVFTLVAIRSGRYVIPGATAKINGRLMKSDDVMIEVITKKQAADRSPGDGNDESVSDYFLRPGEDPYEKMKRNLFMKVMVDRKNCYVGQPVTATFKLYSRLQSKSDIVKNPGFYGFTVHDIVNLNDNVATTETINGKAFEVHTVRCVQLYPLQSGTFSVDPMEISNEIDFSKTDVNKRAAQEITEGVYERAKPPASTYKNTITTDKITIHVKPYPVAKKPASFNGATGRFSIHAWLDKNELAKNEQGTLIVIIEGRGNFTQLSPPEVQWPRGMDSFEVATKDSLDKMQSPLTGSKSFRFPFIASKPGSYQIPPVSLTFFDPDSNNYQTVSASVPEITVTNERVKEEPKKQESSVTNEKKDHSTPWIYGSIFLVVMAIIMFELIRPAKPETVNVPAAEVAVTSVSIEQLLQPAQFSLVADDGRFYDLLKKTIWDSLSIHLKLSGATMNKDALYRAMREKNFNDDQVTEIMYILKECEAAVFTRAEMKHDKQELLDRTKKMLEEIRDQVA